MKYEKYRNQKNHENVVENHSCEFPKKWDSMASSWWWLCVGVGMGVFICVTGCVCVCVCVIGFWCEWTRIISMLLRSTVECLGWIRQNEGQSPMAKRTGDIFMIFVFFWMFLTDVCLTNFVHSLILIGCSTQCSKCNRKFDEHKTRYKTQSSNRALR